VLAGAPSIGPLVDDAGDGRVVESAPGDCGLLAALERQQTIVSKAVGNLNALSKVLALARCDGGGSKPRAPYCHTCTSS
jgi:hypothetical protein